VGDGLNLVLRVNRESLSIVSIGEYLGGEAGNVKFRLQADLIPSLSIVSTVSIVFFN
jgi:hypothetical protein